MMVIVAFVRWTKIFFKFLVTTIIGLLGLVVWLALWSGYKLFTNKSSLEIEQTTFLGTMANYVASVLNLSVNYRNQLMK